MSNDCIFCAIAAGQIPAETVHQDGQHLAFKDTSPAAETHVLVIPREHHDRLDDFVGAGGDSNAMMEFVRDTARSLGVDGRYRLITNVGEGAGQQVHHLHWHLLAGPKLSGF